MKKVNNWEMFYTTSNNNEDLVDQISIDVQNKRYILDIDADIYVTDSVDENDNYTFSKDVSRFIFDLILKSIKEICFIELKE